MPRRKLTTIEPATGDPPGPAPTTELVSARPNGGEKEIACIADLLRCLAEDVQPKQVCWYRGHDDYTWKLLPTLARNPDHLAAELDLLGKFQQDASLLIVN